MIQITPQMRVLVAIEAADFRRGIDGLAQLCRGTLSLDPFLCVVVRNVAARVAGGWNDGFRRGRRGTTRHITP